MLGDPGAADTATTGVLLYVLPGAHTLLASVTGNRIGPDGYGIFATKGAIPTEAGNTFQDVEVTVRLLR